MPYRDRVYGAVSARTGLNPKNAKLAVDATVDLLKTRMPPAVGGAVDAMLASEGGNVLWEFTAGPGADVRVLAAITPDLTKANPVPVIPPYYPPQAGGREVQKPKPFGQRLKELFKKK